jgi:transcriptional regulator with XRE-family HTH domain
VLGPDKEALKKAFGQTLQNMRQEQGFTQEDLSAASESHITYVSLLERGLRLPSLATVFAMAAALGYEPEEMVLRVRKALKKRPKR